MRARLALLLGLCGVAAPAQTQTITGSVMSFGDSAPIARATVTLRGQAGEQSLLTGAGGEFTFGDVPLGGYNLSAERPGYQRPAGPGPTPAAANIVIEADKKPAPVTLRLIQCATLTGSVTDENGLVLPSAAVQLVHRVIADGRARLLPVNVTSTNDLGEFRLTGLSPDSYVVCVSAAGSAYQRRHGQAYPLTCFPDTTEPSAAQWLTLSAGESRHVEFQMTMVHGIRVSGTLSGGSLGISMQRIDRGGFPRVFSVPVELDRKTSAFEARGVPPGDYCLTANFGGMGTQMTSAVQVIHAGTEDIHDIRLTPRNPPTISGTVRMGGTAEAERRVSANLTGDDSMLLYAFSSGRFSQPIQNPGEYAVTVYTAAGWNVQSMTQAGVDVRDRKITVGADAEPEPIEVVLVQGGGAIEVSFAGPATPGATAQVTLLRHALEGNGWVVQNQPMMAATSGKMNLNGVAAGEYLLFAWPMGTEIEYLNPEVIEKYQAFGQRVTVREGETTRVTVRPVVEP